MSQHDVEARLRDLIRLNNDLTSNLDLPTVLRRIVEIGVELVQARHGAMGVIGDERRLEEFIHVGMDDRTVAGIAHLPEGRGLLGALIDDPRPVRLASIASDPRSSGFPAGHPPMDSFIGVPIRVRDRVFGNLYLTDSRNGRFTADDEELAQALAATAGIAIENARLFEDSEYRGRWSTALVEVSRHLMSGEAGDEIDVLDVLIERLRDLANADLVSVAVVPDGADGADGTIVVDRAFGLGAESLVSMSFPVGGTVMAEPLRTGRPAIVRSLAEHPAHGFEEQSMLGTAMIVPFTTADRTGGILCVARAQDRPPFAERDVDMGVSFAGHVSLAMERSESRAARRRVALLEDRSRIAGDLHDRVIQGLFAAGLNLQATANGADDVTADKIMAQVKQVDAAIAQIRQSIVAIRRGPVRG